MVNLSKLKKITNELSHNIEEGEGPLLDFIILILDNLNQPAVILDNKLNLIYGNNYMHTFLANLDLQINPGDNWYKVIYDMNTIPKWCPATDALKQGKLTTKEFISPLTKLKWRTTCIPIANNGTSAVIGISEEMDER